MYCIVFKVFVTETYTTCMVLFWFTKVSIRDNSLGIFASLQVVIGTHGILFLLLLLL